MTRFTDELEQIEIKYSIGNPKNLKLQHASRKDVIDLTIKMETNEFEGCGLELQDLNIKGPSIQEEQFRQNYRRRPSQYRRRRRDIDKGYRQRHGHRNKLR